MFFALVEIFLNRNRSGLLTFPMNSPCNTWHTQLASVHSACVSDPECSASTCSLAGNSTVVAAFLSSLFAFVRWTFTNNEEIDPAATSHSCFCMFACLGARDNSERKTEPHIADGQISFNLTKSTWGKPPKSWNVFSQMDKDPRAVKFAQTALSVKVIKDLCVVVYGRLTQVGQVLKPRLLFPRRWWVPDETSGCDGTAKMRQTEKMSVNPHGRLKN